MPAAFSPHKIRNMVYTFKPIGIIHSPYKEKFGIPRQPLLVKATHGTLELFPPYNHPDTVRGLTGFSHLWITFVFHQSVHQGWAPLVRPPRLGGNTRMGVFATRSPHRPNPCGLSLVELIHIETSGHVTLTLAGIDLLDGTPVIDIKPYLPFIESIPEARRGFAETPPPRLSVVWSLKATQSLYTLSDKPSEEGKVIEDVLAYDPRPAYQDDPERCYGMTLIRYTVRFRITRKQVEVLEIHPYSPN